MIYSTGHMCSVCAHTETYTKTTLLCNSWGEADGIQLLVGGMLDCSGSVADKDERLNTTECFEKTCRPRRVQICNGGRNVAHCHDLNSLSSVLTLLLNRRASHFC